MRRALTTLAALAVLLAGGCTPDPLPTEPAPASGADKTALPPQPGEATLAFWEAMDAFMAGGRGFVPADPAADVNDRGRTLADYLPRDHPWFAHTGRFTYEAGGTRPTRYTVTENLDPDDPYGNGLVLTVRAGGDREWDSPWTPPGWDSYHGTRGELNARFRQAVHRALRIVRTMHRFRAGTTEFWGYPVQAGDVYRYYPDDAGRTFSDLYPGPLPFANAFTGLVTEPLWGDAAVYPGQVAVQEIMDAWGVADGFIVTARGYVPDEYLQVFYREAIVDPPWDGAIR